MDCDTCGRYRPSSEILPMREPDGRLVMACVRCRRPSAGPSASGSPHSGASDVWAVADVVVPPSSEDGILDAFAWFFPDLGLAARSLPGSRSRT